jgi:hypothetical protein
VLSTLFVLPSVIRAANDGRRALVDGKDAILGKNPGAARDAFSRAEKTLGGTASRLGSPIVWPLKVLPVVSTHVRVGQTLARAGADAANIGLSAADLLAGLPESELRFTDGKIDLDTVRRASRVLDARVPDLGRIETDIARMPSGWVVGPLASVRTEARTTVGAAAKGLRKVSVAMKALPSILGEGGKKRYLVAFSGLSELRGSGGLYGYITELNATDGDLDLTDVSGEPTQLVPTTDASHLRFPSWFPKEFREQSGLFLNINLSTDFPTVGDLIVQAVQPTLGQVDGVIAVDPVAIGALLQVTGPITVPSWDGPINATNVSEIAHNSVYLRIPDKQKRDEFYRDLVRTTFGQLTSGEDRIAPSGAGALDLAVQEGHLRMFTTDESDQRSMRSMGLDGGVDRAREATDVLSVASYNATGNKIDWYLHRDVLYRVRLDPGSGSASTELVATYRNEAPASGLPDYVIGSPIAGFPKGVNQQVTMILRTPGDEPGELRIGDEDPGSAEQSEGWLTAYRSTLDIGPRAGTTLRRSSIVADAVVRSAGAANYRLHILPQAVAHPDRYEILIEVPPGWQASGSTSFSGELHGDVVLDVALTRTRRARLLDGVLGPLRRAIHLFS